jgi:Na+-driven multidrug efflux pump
MGVNILLTSIFLIFRKSFVSVFTNQKDVELMVSNVLWIVIIFTFFDFIQGCLCGVIKGLGR